VLCADSEERARYLSKPADLSFLRLRSGRPAPFPSPEEAAEHQFTPAEREAIKAWSASRIVGAPDRVRAALCELVERTGADEVMVTTMAHGPDDRRRSYELLAAAVEVPPRG
jgi:alkanesulfonate monooxygenase SsuD/methylene tetrahydromethanopterin reductase-like flavin-dependent oxidoreductase (luciferase family)